jgi:dihydroflavonol-4-reductase
MNASVTGATGFLGSHLCRKLVNDGYNVTILCRSTSKTDALGNLRLTKIIGDVTNKDAVEKAVTGNDVVFHAAAHLAYWGKQKETQNKINVEGTKNVVEACLRSRVKKLVHVSSVAAIGIPENLGRPANEDFRFNLQNLPLNYHISKKRAEEIVLGAVAKGLDAVIVNPGAIWGRYGEKYRGAEIVDKVRHSEIVPYFTGGICIVHVEDVVEGLIAALRRAKTGERYILGGENLSFKAIAQIAAQVQGLKRRFVPIPSAVTGLAAMVLEPLSQLTKKRPRVTFVTHYCAGRFHYYDSSKAKSELGFSPRNFKTILDECISFLKLRENTQNLVFF